MKVTEVLKYQYEDLRKNVIPQEVSFFDYVKHKINNYEQLVSFIDDDEISNIFTNEGAFPYFQGAITKRRIRNLIRNISCECLRILEFAYKGYYNHAIVCLQNLFSYHGKTRRYLMDSMLNYFNLKFINLDDTNYRVVIYKNDDDVKNCNHVPFEIRHKASAGRFNHPHLPVLYLSDSLEGAYGELPTPEESQKAYYSKFTSIKEINVLNLTLPTDEEIEAMDDYDLFRSVITMPFYIFALSHRSATSGDNIFHDEYLFSQILMMTSNETKNKTLFYQGILYTARDGSHLNIAIPAFDVTKRGVQVKGTSTFIKEHFSEQLIGEYKNQ